MKSILIFEGAKLADEDGKLAFDEYALISGSWPNYKVVIATPNVPMSGLGLLKEALRQHANADSLDLEATISCSTKDGWKPVEKAHWSLGWDDGDYILVHIFPKEFFDSTPDALEVFNQKVLPWVLM